jgi:hypothetical protein
VALLPTPVTTGQTGHLATSSQVHAKLNQGWLDVKADFGAVGDDTTDDYTAIAAAITACPVGGVVFFPPGKYAVGQPIAVKDNITLRGTLDNRWTSYTGTPCYIKPRFGAFTGTTGLITASEVDGWRIRDLGLHSGRATGTAGATLNGLHAVGACKGVRLQNVWINNHSGYGVFTDTTASGFPGGWEVANVDIENNALGGWRSVNTGAVSFAFGDGSMAFCEATANGGDGFYLAGVNAFDFVNVRSVFNTGTANGFYIDGPCGLLGFVACQTDRNIRNGILLHSVDSAPTAQPAPHGISITACHFSRDGKNDNTTGGGYAAIRVQGDSSSVRHCPVTISNITTHVIKEDNGTGLLSPDYAIYITNGRRVTVNGGILVATVATIFDDLGALLHNGATHYLVNVSTGAVTQNVAGYGLMTVEGTNAKMGTATLVAGAATVSTTAVTATSRIFLTNQSLGGTAGFLRVSARTAGTSFTITSSSATDTSTVAWLIVDPA